MILSQIALAWVEQVLVLFRHTILLTILRLDEVFVLFCYAILTLLTILSCQIAVIVHSQVDKTRTLVQNVRPGCLYKSGHLDTNTGFPDFLDERDKIRVTGR